MRFAILFFILFFSASCRSGQKPSDLIPPSEMKSLLWDFMRADQFLADQVFSQDTSVNKYLESTKWYGQILSLHKISQDRFKRSFDYYSNRRPDLMEQILDSIAVIPDRNQPKPVVPNGSTPAK